jgi:hypothetical protein
MSGLDSHATETLIELDSRKRVSLPMAEPGRYLAHVEPDGTIVLVPATVLTRMEASILRSPEIMTAINRAEAAEHTGGRQDRPRRRPAK